MSEYYCEGFVKEVVIDNAGEVTFTLDPVAPYLFEKKEDDGKTKRFLLFVDDGRSPSVAQILEGDKGPRFSAPKGCSFSAVLIAKANHMKVRVKSSLSEASIPVEELTVL